VPRQNTIRQINKIAALEDEGLVPTEMAERLDLSVRWVEKLLQMKREGLHKGSYVFVPDPDGEVRISDEAAEYLAWDPAAYEEFFNRFAKPLKVYAHHRSVLEELFARGTRRLLVNFPPRHGKTRLLTIWFCIWLLCRNRNTTILQLSRTEDVALMFLRELAAQLVDNKDLIRMFGAFAPEKVTKSGSLWRPNSGKLVVTGRNKERAGELNIQARGAGQQVQGLGFDWIIADDLADLDNSETPMARDKLQKWFDQILMSRLTPAGRVITIGTRVAPDDLYGRLALKERKRASGVKLWKHVNYPAVRQEPDLPGTAWNDFDHGYALWPEVWALNEHDAMKLGTSGDDEYTSLEEIYGAMGSDSFNQVYQQVPIPDERRLVKPEWITGEDGSPGCPQRAAGLGEQGEAPGLRPLSHARPAADRVRGAVLCRHQAGPQRRGTTGPS
jgi:hypothetical protein